MIVLNAALFLCSFDSSYDFTILPMLAFDPTSIWISLFSPYIHLVDGIVMNEVVFCLLISGSVAP